MRIVVLLLAVVSLVPLSSCGYKGKLKTPSQVEAEEAKKARREAKKTEKEQQENAESQPEAAEGE